jgi:hypothetical protein
MTLNLIFHWFLIYQVALYQYINLDNVACCTQNYSVSSQVQHFNFSNLFCVEFVSVDLQ